MILDLKPGADIISFFVLRRKEIRMKRDNGDMYLSLELGDASGRISGSMWDDDAQKHYDAIERGQIVKIKAKVVNYKDRLHLNIEKVRVATEQDEVELKQLVPVVDKDLQMLSQQLDDFIKSVENSHLKHLLLSIFSDVCIRKQFERAPGGKLWHHNYLGGLLEHTLSVTTIAEQVANSYPGVNRDLLVSAGLLHDIGKVKSYTYETLIDFTDEGRLLGHIVIGSQMIADSIAQIKNFPSGLATQLQHLILSHQGKLEQASPVLPMTLEGLILYYADELDSKANAFLRIKKKEGKSRWSSYVNLLDRYFFLGSE